MFPASVSTALAALQTALAAAYPLASQPLIGLAPSINAAAALVAVLDTEISALATSIDNQSPTGLAPQLIQQVQSIYSAAILQAMLVTMRGYAGRLLDNLLDATG